MHIFRTKEFGRLLRVCFAIIWNEGSLSESFCFSQRFSFLASETEAVYFFKQHSQHFLASCNFCRTLRLVRTANGTAKHAGVADDHCFFCHIGFPWWLSGKESTCQAGDKGLIPVSGRFPGEGNSNPLQYSCLENPMDGVARCRLLCPWGRKELEMTE